jgi:hypothetical protein
MSINKKKLGLIITGLGVLFVISLALMAFNHIYQGAIPKIVEEINNASIGAIVTAIITVLLLSQQSESEEVKEKNSKIFEKKLEIYEAFLMELENLIQDDAISAKIKSTDSKDKIKTLIFQLARIKMHTNPKNISKVFTDVSEIFAILKEHSDKENSDKENGPLDYNKLTERLFCIVDTFQHELYEKKLGTDKEDLNFSSIITTKTNDIINNAESMGRDFTKYQYKGQELGKGRLVLEVVKDYVKNNPEFTFDELIEVFPNELQGSINTIERLEDAKDRHKKSGYKRHYLNESEIIILKDGPIAVCSQWGIGNIDNFRNHCKNKNIDIQ